MTYHAFPIVAAYSAGWWQVYNKPRSARLLAPKIGIFGLAVPASAMTILLFFGKLNGPTFYFETRPAWVEVVPLILIGGAFGYRKMVHS